MDKLLKFNMGGGPCCRGAQCGANLIALPTLQGCVVARCSILDECLSQPLLAPLDHLANFQF